MSEIRLAEALIPLRMSYNTAQRLIVLGELVGRRDKSGHWWVDEDQLRSFVARGRSSKRAKRALVAGREPKRQRDEK